MRTFSCLCGNRIFFENSVCLACGRCLGFVPEAFAMAAYEGSEGVFRGRRYVPCANRTAHDTCNWMVDSGTGATLCLACSLNDVIPDLSDPRRIKLWYEVEKAKRRLIYSLLSLGLPVVGKAHDRAGLAFRFLADDRLEIDQATAEVDNAVYTGHYEGTITINLLEADPSMREEMRKAMDERYRTLLGHFRHESGHYYWARLVTPHRMTRFRTLFGDERESYRESMAEHYRWGPRVGWHEEYITPYAATHPLEDFAEVWAHYLHMLDTLETAEHAGVVIAGRAVAPPQVGGQFALPEVESDVEAAFAGTLDDWLALSSTLNGLNRSMGLNDAYPFALAPDVVEKLLFVHQLVVGASHSSLGTS